MAKTYTEGDRARVGAWEGVVIETLPATKEVRLLLDNGSRVRVSTVTAEEDAQEETKIVTRDIAGPKDTRRAHLSRRSK